MNINISMLDESKRYQLVNHCEDVMLIDKIKGSRKAIGDHYGDPTCGLIGPKDRWFVTGGEGIQYFDFERGLHSFLRRGGSWEPGPGDPIFIDTCSLSDWDPDEVVFFTDPFSDHGIWVLNTTELRVKRIVHCVPLWAGGIYGQEPFSDFTNDLSDKDLSGRDLAGTDLANKVLIGADLTCANLFRTNLSSAQLTHTIFRFAFLGGANFHNANLSDADLRRANLMASHLADANLTNSNLRMANLSDADCRNTQFVTVDLGSARLCNANLSGADLSGSNLSKANLERAILQDAILNNTHLQAANLAGANLRSASLVEAHLQGAILERRGRHKATFDEKTILPDKSNWTPDTDMARFTDRNHPDFWQPKWVKG